MSTLAPETLQLAQDIVEDLHARGQERRAETVEAVLGVATSTLTRRRRTGPQEYFTPAQLARALGVPRRTIEERIASGKLQAIRLGDQTLVHRNAIQAYSEWLRNQKHEPLRVPTADEKAAEARRRRFILRGLPADKVARLEALHEKMEAGEHLSRAERSEMARLEREVLARASQRLEDWIKRRQGLDT